MSAITLQFDTAADLESALLDALQNNEGHVSGIAAYLAQTGGEAVAPEAKADRAVFEQWYDAQPDGKLSPWDVWQSAIQHAIKSGHACTFALDNGGNLYRRYKEPQCAPPAPPAPLPGKESERDLFKVTFPHLDLEETPDSWGRPEFAKPMVDAIWYGWKHRAALSSPPTLEAAPADYPPLPKISPVDSIPYESIRMILGYCDAFVYEYAREYGAACVDADRAQRSGVSADPLPLVEPTADKPRFQWTCANGCGNCEVKRIEFEYERTETLEGELVGSKTRPQLVSKCCGAELTMWDNEQDEEVDVSITEPAPLDWSQHQVKKGELS